MQFNYNNYTIIFRESYQLLPASLRKLCKSFNVLVAKGFFPHTFINNKTEDILNYIGKYPRVDRQVVDYLNDIQLFLETSILALFNIIKNRLGFNLSINLNQ